MMTPRDAIPRGLVVLGMHVRDHHAAPESGPKQIRERQRLD
jgi:hypothetical protein